MACVSCETPVAKMSSLPATAAIRGWRFGIDAAARALPVPLAGVTLDADGGDDEEDDDEEDDTDGDALRPCRRGRRIWLRNVAQYCEMPCKLRNVAQHSAKHTRKSEEQGNIKSSDTSAPNCDLTIKRTRAAGISDIVLLFRICIGEVHATLRCRLGTVVLGKVAVVSEVVLDALGKDFLAVGELRGPLFGSLVLVKAPVLVDIGRCMWSRDTVYKMKKDTTVSSSTRGKNRSETASRVCLRNTYCS